MENSLKEKIREMTPEAAVEYLTEFIADNPSDTDALTMRGIRYWSLGKRAEAINDYLAAIKIDPECSAKQALQATNDILDYYNKDLYNP